MARKKSAGERTPKSSTMTFGIAAITQALDGLDFPVTRDELLRRADDQEIEYRKGQPVALRPIIEDLDDEEFPSMAEVVRAVSGALKEEGAGSRAEEQEEEGPD